MVAAHMACSLLSYLAFLVAFVSGTLFLIQERQLKRKTMGVLFHSLPCLEVLDRVNFTAIGIGFALLSLGIGCGLVGVRALFGRWWTGDPKEYLAVLLWCLYLVLWVVRLRTALRGRRVALLSVVGFSLSLVTGLGAGWLSPSLHPYRRGDGAGPPRLSRRANTAPEATVATHLAPPARPEDRHAQRSGTCEAASRQGASTGASPRGVCRCISSLSA